MPFILGVDGGATKTLAVVGDDTGRILGAGLGGPTNYQIIGIEPAMSNLNSAVRGALSYAGISMDKVDCAVFGLAGADFPVDFRNLTAGIQKLYPGLKFEIVNDTWVGFRSGTEEDYGGVVIAGTGANFAAAAPDGRKVTGRGMGYEWGGEGGAGYLIRSALHYAFRSNDGTGPKSRLEQVVLSLLDFPSYDDLSLYMCEVQGQFARIYMKAEAIVPAVFQLANEGDEVCTDILMNLGHAMGDIIGRMIKSLGSWQLPQDVVMVGSLFTKGANPLLRDSFALSCHKFVPFARFKMPELEPAGGAYLMGLEKSKLPAKGEARARAIESFGQLELDVPGI
ncbi:MAG: hypothetical protein GX784_00365 [Firmicutes bacterium]|nr:hypothetical protein [Candidatus Fermentithermobacillaceae bacterium]